MLFAINENGDRIKPYKKGVGLCPICNKKVIAVCGLVNLHHWRHKTNHNCDAWKEHETEWHRKWKSEFPENWQEIIIIKNGEKHIADIKSTNGLVVEFQNSSISAELIKEREIFYENMHWLINAINFKVNFNLEMEENQGLVEISCLRKSNEDLIDKKKEIDLHKKRILNKRKEELHYTDISKNIGFTFQALLNGKCDYDFPFPLRNKLSYELKKIQEKKDKLQIVLKELKLKKSTFLNYEKCPHNEYKDYSMVPFGKGKQWNYRKCKVIEYSTT